MLQARIAGQLSPTETLVDSILTCPDALKTSQILVNAMEPSREYRDEWEWGWDRHGRTPTVADAILPGSGALLPP